MRWTPDRVDRLKVLWADGLSAAEIAAELGGVTRNAVIGRVHRMNLTGRKPPGTSLRTRQRLASVVEVRRMPVVASDTPEARKEAVREMWASHLPATHIAARLGITDRHVRQIADELGLPRRKMRHENARGREIRTPEPKAAKLPPEPPKPPTCAPVSLMELTSGACRFPVGKETGSKQMFCGSAADADAPFGVPYCRHHTLIAYQPASARTRFAARHPAGVETMIREATA